MSAARSGVVYLVGAGPGDPGLITVRGRALLDACDAVVHDALVSRDLLTARPGARSSPERHFVGKRGGDARSIEQEDINALLIALARAGKSVVRLKGGDPFVFGRGGEEALALAEAGVPFEVVPGVTAGIAGPAYAGIPVTHRGLATAVTFVTGHEDPTKPETQTDWAALARGGGTIVLYMGVARLPTIVAALMAGGMAGGTPAAAVEWATTPVQRIVEGTIETIAARAAIAGLRAPVLTVIGGVVALRHSIRWFDESDARPLAGQRVLVTRAAGQSSGLSDPLRALGALVNETPVVRIEPVASGPLLAALGRLGEYRHIVFTSQNAVRLVWQALRELGRDARALAGVTVSAVGPTTAAVLLEQGIAVDVSPKRFVAEELLEALRRRRDVAGSRVLYPVAVNARDVLPRGLRELGAIVDVVPIYESVVDTAGASEIRTAIGARSLDLVTLTSASAVRGYVEAVGSEMASRLPAASIGPVTSDAARAAGIPVAVEAQEATIAGLVDAVVRHAASGRPHGGVASPRDGAPAISPGSAAPQGAP